MKKRSLIIRLSLIIFAAGLWPIVTYSEPIRMTYEEMQNNLEHESTERLARDPSSPEAHNDRGIAYRMNGQQQEAIEEFTKAIELDPKYVEAYRNRALSYGSSSIERYKEAMADFNTAAALNPDNGEIYFERAQLCSFLQMDAEARKDIEYAVAIGYKIPQDLREEIKMKFPGVLDKTNKSINYSTIILIAAVILILIALSLLFSKSKLGEQRTKDDSEEERVSIPTAPYSLPQSSRRDNTIIIIRIVGFLYFASGVFGLLSVFYDPGGMFTMIIGIFLSFMFGWIGFGILNHNNTARQLGILLSFFDLLLIFFTGQINLNIIFTLLQISILFHPAVSQKFR